MAEFASPDRRADDRDKVARVAPGAAGDRIRRSRTAERDSDHEAILAGRARGPEPIQRRAKVGPGALVTGIPGAQAAPVQRIEIDPDEQLVVTILSSATRHGYSGSSLESIVRSRLLEVELGQGRTMTLGHGFDSSESGSSDQSSGRLAYNCVKTGSTYRVTVFHAHGGQTETGNTRGY